VDQQTLYEIVGYAASILIAISLMMRSILRLRVINLIGAIFFTVYGLLIGAYPVAVVNFVIVLIDLYYLYQIFTAKQLFKLMPVRHDSQYLGYFLDFYRDDITRFEPSFDFNLSPRQMIFFFLRDMVPAGVFIGETIAPNTLFILLDYVIPGYRDFKLGWFLYSRQTDMLHRQGIHTIFTRPGNETHVRYLKRMGFRPESSQQGELLYCLRLKNNPIPGGAAQARGE
jgi:hypothetical protein